MDWNRAKTLLIVAFLFLNLFLAWQYAQNRMGYVTEELAESSGIPLEELLRVNQVTLAGPVPDEVVKAKPRFVTYQRLQSLERGFPVVLSNMDEEEGIRESIRQYLPLIEEFSYDGLLSREREGERVYFQRLEQGVAFSAPLLLYLEDGGEWQGYTGIYVEEEGEGEEQQLLSGAQTLGNLLENRYIPAGARVEEVRFGYYGRFLDADVQVLAPVWRVVYAAEARAEEMASPEGESMRAPDAPLQRQMLYVNAVTGRVEVADPLETLLQLPDNGKGQPVP